MLYNCCLCEHLNTCPIHGTQENPAFILPLYEVSADVTKMTLLNYIKYYLLYIMYIKKTVNLESKINLTSKDSSKEISHATSNYEQGKGILQAP